MGLFSSLKQYWDLSNARNDEIHARREAEADADADADVRANPARPEQPKAAAPASRTTAPRGLRMPTIDESVLRILDLRDVDSVRTRIKGSGYVISDSGRAVYGGTQYLLLREPNNRQDASAVAIYGKGVRVGYVSQAKAASLAPILDALTEFDAFRVSGAGVDPASIRLWVDLPLIPALRAAAKR